MIGPIERDLLAHYAAVHRRLWPAPPKPQPKIAAPPIASEQPPPPPSKLPPPLTLLGDCCPLLTVIHATCTFYELSVAQLVGPFRLHPLVVPRHVAMYLCFDLYPKSTSVQIGRRFHRDHSTAIHARKKITADLVADRELADEVACIRHMVQES